MRNEIRPLRIHIEQECIPVGCVPSAAVAMYIPAYTGQGGLYPRIQWAGVCVSKHTLGRGCLPGGVS